MRLFITSDLNLGHNDADLIRNVILDSPQYQSSTADDVLVLLGDLASVAVLAEPAIEGTLTLFENFPGTKLLVIGNQDLGLDQEDPKFGENQSIIRYNEWFPRAAKRHGFRLLDAESVQIGNVGFIGSLGPITADEILTYPAYHDLSTDLPDSADFEAILYERFCENLAKISDTEIIVAFLHFPPLIPKPEKIESTPLGWAEYPRLVKGRTVLASQFWQHFEMLQIQYIFCASFHHLLDWGPIHYTRSIANNIRFLWVEI